VAAGKLNPALHGITVLEGFANRVGLRDERRIIPEDEAESSLRTTLVCPGSATMARSR
jgi:hypothetical protein